MDKAMLWISCLIACAAAQATEIELSGWTPSNDRCVRAPGKGRDGGEALATVGKVGKTSDYYTWTSAPVTFRPDGVYGMSFWVDRERSGSEILCRTSFHNLLLSGVAPGWCEIRTVMRAPSDGATCSVALSDFNCQAHTYFDRPRLVELEPRYRTEGGVTLGRGEVIAGNHYYFTTQRACEAGGDARVLEKVVKTSSGDKFILKKGSEVVYRFRIPERRLVAVRGVLAAVYGKNAAVEVDASSDGTSWRRLATVTNGTPYELVFPAALFPADELVIRMRGSEKMDREACSQIQTLNLVATFEGAPLWLAGATTYVEKGTDRVFLDMDTMKYRVARPGYRLDCSSSSLSLWGASSGSKVFRDMALPAARGRSLAIKAAANEAEAVQLVITPRQDVANVHVEASPLVARRCGSQKMEVIPASAVDVLRVGYVDVRIVTDKVGLPGLWPDPLLPQNDSPLAVKAGENQPMWVRVKVPKGTPKGVYGGVLKVMADAETVEVPLEVEVFGFELADRMTLRTRFGFHPGTVYRYHKTKTPEERDLVREKYVKLLLDSHVTPYYWSSDFFPKARLCDADDPKKMRIEIDFAEWDREMSLVIDKYHGTSVKLAPEGLGGGNHDNRKPAQICGVKRGDPRYEILMKSYLEQFVRHLKEKGWLQYAFVYWFDEPNGQDYDFVNEGMATVRRYAPELNRMITNLCAKELMETVDTWCPTVQHLKVPLEKACRDRGDEMWWYICCSPREAPVGEHIDHPGVDMRVWSWQSWGENVTGMLVWATEWWTGKARYPDPERPQDPYLDPMGWGKSHNPNRIVASWCNGDGRYFYPPLACRDARQPQTVLDDPVTCYRLELLRDGIEDYEYLAMLKRLDPESGLLSVPKDVYRGLYDYSQDPGPMEAHREKLARAIEARLAP